MHSSDGKSSSNQVNALVYMYIHTTGSLKYVEGGQKIIRRTSIVDPFNPAA